MRLYNVTPLRLLIIGLAFLWSGVLFGQTIIGRPLLPLNSADVVLEPPTNTLYFWFDSTANPYGDGTAMGIGTNAMLNSPPMPDARYDLTALVNGTSPIIYSNNIVNSKSALVWGTGTPSSLYGGDSQPTTTISGWTLVILYKVTANTTDFNTEVIWQNTYSDRGLYYNIQSSGSGNVVYWMYANGSAQAFVTNSPGSWQIMSCRFQYSSGVPELRDNVNNIIGTTGTSANEAVAVPILYGAKTNMFAEMLFYTNRLSDDDLILARRYFTNKYAIVATP